MRARLSILLTRLHLALAQVRAQRFGPPRQFVGIVHPPAINRGCSG